MDKITIEEAFEIAKEEAAKEKKVVVKVEENAEWWRFGAERADGQRVFDDGAGSVYINKKTGEIRPLKRWEVDFTRTFYETAKPVDLP